MGAWIRTAIIVYHQQMRSILETTIAMRQSDSNLVHRSHGHGGVSKENGAHFSAQKNENAARNKEHSSSSTHRFNLLSRPILLLFVIVLFVYCILSYQELFKKTGEPFVAFETPRIASYQARPPPLMIQLQISTSNGNTNKQTPLNHATIPRAPQYALQNVTKRAKVHEDSDASYWSERPQWPKEGCEALGDWMTGDNSNCNTFHEIDMTSFSSRENNIERQFRYIKDGGFRIAWMTAEYNGNKRVLKTLRYIDKRPFDLDNLERHGRDAIAMEQLTHSPYIADIYGHCAQSALVDYSPHVTLYHIFDDEDDDYPTYDELFQISYDAVAAVADCHHFNNDGKATIVHKDIKPNQWIYLNGRYMLNDFNLAKFLTWNPEKKRNCGRATGYSSGRVSVM